MALTYARDNIRYSRTAIDQAVAEGFAKAFETAKGIFYVLKTDQGSFKVTPDMIDEDGMSPEEQAEEEDFHRQAYLAEQGLRAFPGDPLRRCHRRGGPLGAPQRRPGLLGG
ncbi:hypothetical protein SEA_FRAYBELL_153 [Mycobacterium phage FrayBell]|nr:hypothetical protein SEA_FRAYBELL_153 [Mycobacterium phage FrayBell]